MVHVGGVTALGAGTAGQAAGGRAGPPGLELGPFAGLPAPVTAKAPALVVGAVAGGGQVHDAPVHPDPVHRLERLRIREVAGGDQEPLRAPAHQIALALAVGHEGFELVGRAGEPDPFHPPLDGPDRDGARVVLPGQAAVVERLAHCGRKTIGVPAALRYRLEVGGPRFPACRLAFSVA
jgi:hypothetical protein